MELWASARSFRFPVRTLPSDQSVPVLAFQFGIGTLCSLLPKSLEADDQDFYTLWVCLPRCQPWVVTIGVGANGAVLRGGVDSCTA